MRTEVFTFADAETGQPCKAAVTAETRGLCIRPEGTGTFDSDCGPIYLEVQDGRPVLYVWADINGRRAGQDRPCRRVGIEPPAGRRLSERCCVAPGAGPLVAARPRSEQLPREETTMIEPPRGILETPIGAVNFTMTEAAHVYLQSESRNKGQVVTIRGIPYHVSYHCHLVDGQWTAKDYHDPYLNRKDSIERRPAKRPARRPARCWQRLGAEYLAAHPKLSRQAEQAKAAHEVKQLESELADLEGARPPPSARNWPPRRNGKRRSNVSEPLRTLENVPC